MKLFLAVFFSLLFSFIIIAPATIMITDMNKEITMFFQLGEDDQKEEAVNKGVFVNEYQLNSTLVQSRPNSSSISWERYDNSSLEIFLPPPR